MRKAQIWRKFARAAAMAGSVAAPLAVGIAEISGHAAFVTATLSWH